MWSTRLAFFAMRQSLECRDTWRVQCRDMHVHGYAILELLPRRNHAQSLYCDGENEQCGKARTFLSRQQVWPSRSLCTRSTTRREWYRASTRARRQAKFDWTKDAPISDRQVLEKYQEDCGTRPSAEPRGAPHAEQESCCVG